MMTHSNMLLLPYIYTEWRHITSELYKNIQLAYTDNLHIIIIIHTQQQIASHGIDVMYSENIE